MGRRVMRVCGVDGVTAAAAAMAVAGPHGCAAQNHGAASSRTHEGSTTAHQRVPPIRVPGTAAGGARVFGVCRRLRSASSAVTVAQRCSSTRLSEQVATGAAAAAATSTSTTPSRAVRRLAAVWQRLCSAPALAHYGVRDEEDVRAHARRALRWGMTAGAPTGTDAAALSRDTVDFLLDAYSSLSRGAHSDTTTTTTGGGGTSPEQRRWRLRALVLLAEEVDRVLGGDGGGGDVECASGHAPRVRESVAGGGTHECAAVIAAVRLCCLALARSSESVPGDALTAHTVRATSSLVDNIVRLCADCSCSAAGPWSSSGADWLSRRLHNVVRAAPHALPPLTAPPCPTHVAGAVAPAVAVGLRLLVHAAAWCGPVGAALRLRHVWATVLLVEAAMRAGIAGAVVADTAAHLRCVLLLPTAVVVVEDGDAVTPVLDAAASAFLVQVLEACPSSAARLLLGAAPPPPPPRTLAPAHIEAAVTAMIALLARGGALRAAWRWRHGRVCRAGDDDDAAAIASAAAAAAESLEVQLQRWTTVRDVESRLCRIASPAAVATTTAAAAAPLLASLLASLPDAASTTAATAAALETLSLLLPLSPEKNETAAAVTATAAAPRAGSAGRRHRDALAALESTLASVPDDAVRAEVGQALLSRLCAATLAGCAHRRDRAVDVALTDAQVRGAIVALGAVLSCTSTSADTASAATAQLLSSTLAVVVADVEQVREVVYAALREGWAEGELGRAMRIREVQLTRHAAESTSGASPAVLLARWWSEQPSRSSSSGGAATVAMVRRRAACCWTSTRIMRLCSAAARVAATATSGAAAVTLANTAVDDTVGVAYLCHLADAAAAAAASSAASSPRSAASTRSCVSALAAGSRTSAEHDGTPSSGLLHVWQHHRGRPITDAERERLAVALQSMSRHRRVHEAVALFYTHERQHRRLTLEDVVLFAEAARRAPLVFLVRLLRYVPPPCESAALAHAIVAGAWKAYQRAVHQHSRRSDTVGTAWQRRHRLEQAWLESLAVACRALQLLPRTTATDEADTLMEEEDEGDDDHDHDHDDDHQQQQQRRRHRRRGHRGATLLLLERLVRGRPRSMRLPPSDTEWRSDAVQTSQLVAALLWAATAEAVDGGARLPLLHDGPAAGVAARELQQVVALADANEDAATAAQAYVRFVSAHAPLADSTAAVPLLPLDQCVSLLRLASQHALTSSSSSSASSMPVSLAELAATVTVSEQQQQQQQQQDAAVTSAVDVDAHDGGVHTSGDAELDALVQMRAALDGGDDTPVVTAHRRPVQQAQQRRTRSDASCCVDVVQRLSTTLPAPLLRALEADTSLVPQAAVLHDALRWCRLRPRGAAHNAHALSAETETGDAAVAATVVARLVAAALQLDISETHEAVDAAGGTSSGCVWVSRHTFTSRAAHADADAWRLARHGAVLLAYIWDYTWGLYELEETVLWLSPAQLQRARLAALECAQVIIAAAHALDLQCAAMAVHDVGGSGAGSATTAGHERRTNSEGDTRVTTDAVGLSTVDDCRCQLRHAILPRLRARLDPLGDVSGGAAEVSQHPRHSWSRRIAAAAAAVTAALRAGGAALESCAPTSSAMRLTRAAAAAADNTSTASPRAAHELVTATTQSYYDSLGALLRAVDTPPPAVPCGGGLECVSYAVRCVSAATGDADVEDGDRGGGACALVVRVARLEHVLRRIASLTQRAEVLLSSSSSSSSSSSAALLCIIWRLSADFEYAVESLDAALAWWRLLHFEGATAVVGEGPSAGGAIDGGACEHVGGGVRWSAAAESMLRHTRVQLASLTAMLTDAYVSGWWGCVYTRLSAAMRARVWARNEARAQHLYVSVVLRHHASDATTVARWVTPAEALQQALLHNPPLSAASAGTDAWAAEEEEEEDGVGVTAHRDSHVDSIDLDALMAEESDGSATSVQRASAAAAAARATEAVLLAHLTTRDDDGMVTVASDSVTVVPVAALLTCIDAASRASSPHSTAARHLRRLLPALLDDRCCAAATAASPGPTTCAVDTAVWRALTRLGDASAAPLTASAAAPARGECEHLVVSAALLSRAPLTVCGVLAHPLLRRYAEDAPSIASLLLLSHSAEDVGAGELRSTIEPPLQRRFVAALVLAVLQDPSLVSGAPDGAGAEDRREELLQDVVRHLGDVAPHAWRTAWRWCCGTPFPHSTAAVHDGAALRHVDVVALRRLRGALQACGPWPSAIAHPLLTSAVRLQRPTATTAAAAAAAAVTSLPFAEAFELERVYRDQSGEARAAGGRQRRVVRVPAAAPAPTRASRFLVDTALEPPQGSGPRGAPADACVALSALQHVGAMATEAAEATPARLLRRLHDVATAASPAACARLLLGGEWAADTLALPPHRARAAVVRAWQVLLLRLSELTYLAHDWTEAESLTTPRSHSGATTSTTAATTTTTATHADMVDVCTIFFLVVSRLADRSDDHRALVELKREVAAFWAAECAGAGEAVEDAVDSVTLRARVERYCSCDGEAVAVSSAPPRRPLQPSLRSHLRRANAALTEAAAPAELLRTQAAAAAHLRDAVTALLATSPEAVTAYTTWTLWPPRCWEAHRLRTCTDASPAAHTPVATLLLRHPGSVVACLAAWQRERVSGRAEARVRLRPLPLTPPRSPLSLSDVWRAVDAYVRDGHLAIACVSGASACSAPAEVNVGAAVAGVTAAGAQVVMHAFLDCLSHEDARVRRHTSAGDTASDATLTHLSVLRELRSRLLPPPHPRTAAAAAATVHQRRRCAAAAAAADSSMAWAAFIPLYRVAATSPTRCRSGWRTYLHVLHLCTGGWLDRAAQHRQRRATPSAAAVARVADRLRSLHGLVRGGTASRGCVMSEDDVRRILFFEIRGLESIRRHVNTHGWTPAQEAEEQLAEESLWAATAVLRHGQRRRHTGNGGHGGSAPSETTPRTAGGDWVRRATADSVHADVAGLLLPHPAAKRGSSGDAPRAHRDEAASVITVVANSRPARRPTAAAAVAALTTSASTATAAALLADLQAALDAASPPRVSGASHATAARGEVELHALLAVAVAVAQQRERDVDAPLLLRLLAGEDHRALRRLAAAAEAPYLELLARVAALPATTSLARQRAVDGCLALYALLHPWLCASETRVTVRATEAALRCVADVCDGVTWATVTSRASPAVIALDRVLRLQQAAPLSAQSVALLGIIFGQLAEATGGAQVVEHQQRQRQRQHQTNTGAPLSLATTEAALLLRLLSALDVMSERCAAAVRDAWAEAAWPSTRSSSRSDTPSVAESSQRRGGRVVELLYRAALRLLCRGAGDGSGVTPTCDVADAPPLPLLRAVTRLRTWLAQAEAASAAGTTPAAQQPCPPLCVLEEALCRVLSGAAGTSPTGRRGWLACRRLGDLHRSLRHVSGVHPPGRSSLASVLLELAAAVHQWRQRATAVAASDVAALLDDFTRGCDRLEALPHRAAAAVDRHGGAPPADLLGSVELDVVAAVQDLASHLLLLCRRGDGGGGTDASAQMTASSSSLVHAPCPPPLQGWRATLLPLRAVQRAVTLCSAADEVMRCTRLTCTVLGGLQWTHLSSSSSSSVADVRDTVLFPVYYTTLQLLCRASQLLDAPVPVLLDEVLRPLARLEEATARESASTCGDDAKLRRVGNRLAVLAEVAVRLAEHPALRHVSPAAMAAAAAATAATAATTATDAGVRHEAPPPSWVTAVSVYDALARLEEALHARCGAAAAAADASGSAAPADSPSSVFAIHHADLLARRGACAHAFISFVLVVSRRCPALRPPAQENWRAGGEPAVVDADALAFQRQRVQQLRHAVALAATPAAVGAVMELLHHRTATAGSVDGATGAADRDDALSAEDAALVERLHRLLQPQQPSTPTAPQHTTQ
ncbi:hypothetical protein NESM_000252800 [Novymonas esmeraldas]|uniref:Non-specific serine/threonine protein kinase n=1 Tax=Novymonas esmeraldas TaxID=1808958 RepID=A0AAW0F7V1_9TRYP